ncbi:hypothetical protein MMC10_002284 [Thelotrema lepadinum]|nr:hypothetical protein [Thelotrema lepadinum]
MSMQAWDAPNPNDNGVFNPTLDPSMAFASTPNSSNYDFSMQSAQLQRMQNGNMRNGSGSPAGFQNPMYQTSSVIPSKRAHDFNESPRHASRSQTPQQAPYPGFTGAVNGQAQNPYQQRLHQNSSNASPSPIMQNQQFNPSGGVPPRMQTASPSPYSPAGANFAPQASPVQSDYGSRVDTPSNGGQPYIQGVPYANGMHANAQNFTPPQGNMAQGFPANPAFNGNNMTPEQQRAFELKRINMMRQLQSDNMMASHRHQQMTSNPMMNNPNSAAMQQAAMRQINARNVQQLEIIRRQPDQFASTVQQFMATRNSPFLPQPNIGGRPIHCSQIFYIVMRSGGSKRVTVTNNWPQIANALQLHPSAVQELASYWQQNFLVYEAYFTQRQMQQGAQVQTGQGDVPGMGAGPMPPGRQPNYSQEQIAAMHARRASASFQTPTKAPGPGQLDPRQPQMNGFSPSHDMNQHNHAMTPQFLQGNQKIPRAHQAEVVTTPDKRKSAQSDRNAPASNLIEMDPQVKGDFRQERSDPIGDTFKPTPFPFHRQKPNQTTPVESHGGIVVKSPNLRKSILELEPYKPEVSDPSRYGNIDLHALIMGLKSGLPGEVKLALNLLWSLTGRFRDPSRGLPPLNECDDLLESLIDCAEIQLEFLADNAPEVSDVMLISPYEELCRNFKSDNLALQDIPEFASLEYQLENAAQRLLAISAIVRNLSDGPYELNLRAVAEPVVVKFMTTVIRYLGTRNNLLRTNRNALDFIKDAVVYMGNVAQYINFSGKEEALCILQFLLSFAPLPQPTVSDSIDLNFPVYEPIQHRYIPLAIQTLAKLLACGEPNRTYLKSIFANDLASSPSLDLLTRTFGLCIAPLPEQADETMPEMMLKIKSRASFLAQGLLAADSLISFIPPSEHTLAHAWLASQDNFAHRLLRIVARVGIKEPQNPVANPALRRGHMGQAIPEDYGQDVISSYGVSILRKLAERAKDADHVNGFHVPSSEISKKRVLMEGLKATRIDPRFLQQLSIYATLDD